MGPSGDVTWWAAVTAIPPVVVARSLEGFPMEGWFILFAVVGAVWLMIRD